MSSADTTIPSYSTCSSTDHPTATRFQSRRLISEEKYVIKETTLYSAFTRLEKNGYITSFSSSDNASGKRRTYYQITDAGREYYRMKCEEWKLTLDVVSKFIRF